jgi:hypothetical protein
MAWDGGYRDLSLFMMWLTCILEVGQKLVLLVKVELKVMKAL